MFQDFFLIIIMIRPFRTAYIWILGLPTTPAKMPADPVAKWEEFLRSHRWDELLELAESCPSERSLETSFPDIDKRLYYCISKLLALVVKTRDSNITKIRCDAANTRSRESLITFGDDDNVQQVT